MPQLFAPRADVILRTVLVGAVAFAFVMALGIWAFARSPAATGQFQVPHQPVAFAHPLHVNALRIDCRYCHAGAERSAMAGLPPTAACIPCHQDQYLQSNLFTAVRESMTSGHPIPWRRVTNLPDFVFFNHAAHTRSGIGCETCHGPVHLMQQVYQAAPLTMEWCLECHRAPERYVRPRETSVPGWVRGDQDTGRSLVARYDLRTLTSYTTCHR